MLASRNAHKLREFERLLPGHELVSLPEDVELPPESGATFAENARVKAVAAAAGTGMAAFADDSGIEAAALGGAPGVRSARYAGDGAADEDNLGKLLEAVPVEGDRDVRYVCALAFVAGPDAPAVEFEATCEGSLATRPRGQGGFGYDPAFVPDEGDGRTMAELSDADKDAISHRGRAARAFASWLESEAAPR